MRAAVQTVLDELPDLPHLPELPARGPHASMIARTCGLLPGIHVDMQPSGWRLVPRPGLDERRAKQTLTDDIDMLATVFDGYEGPLKTQLCGPVTLGAALELQRAGRAVNDQAAMRDLALELAESVTTHLSALRASIPAAQYVVQIDEPGLPAALGGLIPRESGLGRYRALDREFAEGLLREVTAAIHGSGATAVVHCCAGGVPLEVLGRVGADALSLDATLLTERDDDQLAELIEGGLAVWWGAVGSLDELSVPAATLVRTTASRLGIGADTLAAAVVVTPTCGLAGADPAWSRRAMRLARHAVGELSGRTQEMKEQR